MGIESELGRKVDGAHFAGRHRQAERSGKKPAESTQRILDLGEHSIFDPVGCELAYHWFCPHKESKILDPFAGGSVRRSAVLTSLGPYVDPSDVVFIMNDLQLNNYPLAQVREI